MAAERLIAVGRTLVAGGVVYGWLGALDLLPGPVQLAASPAGLGRVLPLAVLFGTVARVLATVLVVALAVLVARRRHLALAAAWLFVLFVLVSRVELASAESGPSGMGHGKVLPGATMVALGVGGFVGRKDDDRGEQRGVEYAAGIAAALYVWAALAKLGVAGFGWVGKAHLPMLVYERSFRVGEPLAGLRRWLGTHPPVVVVGGALAVATEMLGVTFAWPRARVGYAALVTAMHLGIAVAVGYLYLEWMLVMWGLAIWTRGLEARALTPR